MWVETFGDAVDGVISVDPVAISYALRAAPPIAVSTGDSLTSDNLTSLLLNEVYFRYNTGDLVEDGRLQDLVYSEAVHATFSQMISGGVDPVSLVKALVQGWNEHRILFWSANPDQESILVDQHLAGGLPDSDDKTDRVGVYIQDNVGSKLNFYLRQAVRLSSGTCRADGLQTYRVSVDLSTTLQHADVGNLSRWILGQWEPEGLPPGVQRLLVYLYAPPGSQIIAASMDGVPIALEAEHDTDYPVGKVLAYVPPGGATTVTYEVVAAKGRRTLEAQVTPLVTPTPVTNETLNCATVAP